jgi:Kef-type K+ transport system membrane component KefB
MPKERNFVRDLTEKLEGLPVILLLPLFFTATGLRTRIELISGAEMWFYCALIIIVATAGKLGGSMLSSRISGMTWREAGSLGLLMNTRGLMELVILNIGFDIGVISPALFSMMVLMAIVTTFMTSPVLELVYRDQPATKETMIVNEQLA